MISGLSRILELISLGTLCRNQFLGTFLMITTQNNKSALGKSLIYAILHNTINMI